MKRLVAWLFSGLVAVFIAYVLASCLVRKTELIFSHSYPGYSTSEILTTKK